MEPTRPPPPPASPPPAGAAPRTGASPFVPMLMLALAVFGWFGFQALQLALEQSRLQQARTSQQAQYEAATKLRAALDSMASATAKLATDGNANARVVVEELRKRGVAIRP